MTQSRQNFVPDVSLREQNPCLEVSEGVINLGIVTCTFDKLIPGDLRRKFNDENDRGMGFLTLPVGALALLSVSASRHGMESSRADLCVTGRRYFDVVEGS
jgi:hypothetical protein